jgi:hypothetical protein
MSATSRVLAAIGAIIIVVTAINHYLIKANPIPHTSTFALAVGAVLLLIGLAMMAKGGASRAN